MGQGERDVQAVRNVILRMIEQTPECAVDYVEIVDAVSLAPLERIEGRAVMALAVRVGATRLIDNATLEA